MKDIGQNKKTPKNVRTHGPQPKRGLKRKIKKVRQQKEILQNESY